MKAIRLIELFAGIGSQAAALKRLGVDFEHYKAVEFDKYAIKSYNAVHATKSRFISCRQTKRNDKRQWYKVWTSLGSRTITK